MLHTKEFYEKEYSLSKKTQRQIAEENGISKSLVGFYIKKFGILKNKKLSNNVNDITNQKFGKLTVINRTGTSKHRKAIWLCICECGTNVEVTGFSLRRGHTKSCGCDRWKTGKNNPSFTGYEGLNGVYYNEIVNRARYRKLEINVTPKYLWELYISQDKKCPLTKSYIYFKDCNNKYGTASLDRIDSSKGYIEGNVQWVHKKVNIMKMQLNQEELIYLCNVIAKNNYIEIPENVNL